MGKMLEMSFVLVLCWLAYRMGYGRGEQRVLKAWYQSIEEMIECSEQSKQIKKEME